MINIIKSLNYSARREASNWITIATILVIPLLGMYLMGMIRGDSLQKVTPSFYFATQMMGIIFMITCLGIIILACNLVAGDGGDKTMNYEILSGHSRNRIFAARMLAGFLWGGVSVFLLTLLPLGYLTLAYGWGLETNPREVLLRSLLAFFPILRLCIFHMMIASIMRSAGKGIAVGYVAYMVITLGTSALEELFGMDIIYQTGMTNAAFLLTSGNSRNVVMDGRTVALYDTRVTSDMIKNTIGVSLAFSALYLIIAYINFKKKDRD